MNQKDYKVIAEKIRVEKDISNRSKLDGTTLEQKKIILYHFDCLARSLAEHFDTRKHVCSCSYPGMQITKRGEQEHCYCPACKDDYYRDIRFDKQQFLKGCGVE